MREEKQNRVHSIAALAHRAASCWPTSEIVFPQERISYAELDIRITNMARLICAVGAKPGTHVGVLLNPSIDMIATLFGIARAGCVIVPISDRLKVVEVQHIVQHADLEVIVSTGKTPSSDSGYPDFVGLLAEALPALAAIDDGVPDQRMPYLRRVVLLHGGTSAPRGFVSAQTLHAELNRIPEADIAAAEHAIKPSDLAYILYTSGTSARAKGCIIPHANVIAQGYALANHRYFLSPEASFWCPLPLFHNGGLATLTACLVSGARFVHAGHFDPSTALRQLEEERCTHAIPAFETIWLPILNHSRFHNTDLSALRIILNAGSEARLREFQSRMPNVTQLSNYGSTECSGHFSMTLPTDSTEVSLTTGGRPLPGMQARVVDIANGQDCHPGEDGEILVRGTMLFRGYYKAPEYTHEVIDPQGWFHTGDLGRLDKDGRLTFAGRIKEMIKVGGENVAPMEVEAFLLHYPGVDVAVVVGAPDAIYTEVPAAFIQISPGTCISEKEIVNYCLGRIATFKVPRYVRFVTDWPMSGTKIKKHVLRQEITNELSRRGIEAAPRLSTRMAFND